MIAALLTLIALLSPGVVDQTYTNPIIDEIGPADPTVIFVDGTYYLYPTGDNVSYHVYTSKDLVHWTKGRKVFEPGPKGVWAPDVFRDPKDGKFYLYYTVGENIGVAVADRPDGTFVDRKRLFDNAIDAHMFCDDDGKYYLYYVQFPGFRIHVQPMKSPLEKAGEPIELFHPTEPWEKVSGNVTEGPWMVKHEGTYYLLYSGTGANSLNYAIGYATASKPTGPFTKYAGNPIVHRTDRAFGPGHGCVVKDSVGNLWSVYHQQKDDSEAWNRFVCIDPLWFDDKGVLHGKATRGTPEPAPVILEGNLSDFIQEHVKKLAPLWKEANLTYWDATTTGKSEAWDKYEALQLEIKQLYSSRKDFARIKALKEVGPINDPRLARQLEKLYYAYLPNQIEPELLAQIVELDTQIQKAYNSYRGSIDGQDVTMSDIYTIMTTEGNTTKREAAWRASKQVGNVIIDDFLRLVRLRNQAARQLGFGNYHTMMIVAGEQDVAELDRIFSQLDTLTRKPFAEMKKELDAILAKSYGIAPEALMPWHYHDPFFQRTPLVYELDLDQYYKGRSIEQLAKRYYDGVDLVVDDILARSDLYDREGKYPHAYGFDADREGDARVLANLQDTERWMETLLHELGHALYSKYHDRNEPWLLREPAHSFTTEAVAMFFGRLSRNAAWMQQMLGLSDEETARIRTVSDRYLQFQQILFVRWALVMYNFEKALYADPDQDLNNLWWDLVERYQFVRRPPGKADAGWASKLHFTTAPCYYHNYVLGELLASQWHHHLVHEILKLDSDEGLSYVGDRRIGRYFRDNVLGPGARYRWDEMIVRSTGEPLTPKYFVEQFIQ